MRQVNLTVGGQGTVLPNSRNNIRRGAGTGFDFLGQIWPGEIFDVIGGPRCVGGLQWWQIEFNGIRGWTAAGDAANQWLEPIGNTPIPTRTPERPFR